MKKIVVGVLMTALALTLITGCARAPKTKKVALLTAYLSSVTTAQMVADLEAGVKTKGWESMVVDTKNDFSQLASRFEDVISAKVDAVVLVSTEPTQLKAQIAAANKAGIPVYGCDSGFAEGMSVNATSDNAEMSKLISEYFLKAIGNKGKIVVLTHRPHPGVLKRTQTLDTILKEHPDVTVLAEQQVEVPGPIENSRKIVENLLLANPGKDAIAGIWCGWDEPAIGSAQAIEAAKRSGIVVTGIDGTSQAVKLIKEGSIVVASVAQNFKGMTTIVIDAIAAQFAGQKNQPGDRYAPATLITK